jgi:FtsH-binding integral membrane protein
VLFRKYSRRTVGLAGFGLLVAVVVAVFLLSTDSYPNPPHELSTPVLVTILVLCPPSMLSALVIDAETGTSAFYFVWFFIALLNAVLYAAVGAAVARCYRGLR